MSGRHVEQVKKEIWQEYLDRTPASQAHNQSAKDVVMSLFPAIELLQYLHIMQSVKSVSKIIAKKSLYSFATLRLERSGRRCT